MAISRDELNSMTREELYARGRSNVDALVKRMRRLEENVTSKPGEYNNHGLKILQGNDPKGAEGIPVISMKSHLATLKANVRYSEHLRDMRTTSSKGAREVNNEFIMKIIDIPERKDFTPEERKEFEKAQKDAFKEAKEFFKADPTALNDFWDAFKKYQEDIKYKNLDSGRELDAFREITTESPTDPLSTKLASITEGIRKIAFVEREEEKARSDMHDILTADSPWKDW